MLDGIEAHGRVWDKVAKRVGTRTRGQTKAHADKYFKRLAREAGAASLGVPQPPLSRLLPGQNAPPPPPILKRDAARLPISHVKPRRVEFKL